MSEREFTGYVPVPGGRLWAQWAGQGTGVVLAHERPEWFTATLLEFLDGIGG